MTTIAPATVVAPAWDGLSANHDVDQDQSSQAGSSSYVRNWTSHNRIQELSGADRESETLSECVSKGRTTWTSGNKAEGINLDEADEEDEKQLKGDSDGDEQIWTYPDGGRGWLVVFVSFDG